MSFLCKNSPPQFFKSSRVCARALYARSICGSLYSSSGVEIVLAGVCLLALLRAELPSGALCAPASSVSELSCFKFDFAVAGSTQAQEPVELPFENKLGVRGRKSL
eukprot:CAMPEP_0177733210 /NCGR_PEP_ID=MMETSP0484_2-20121128/23551_1 /TAXON_ID=354590 /ORGANISM="Rhodomonas lens, Strain RHODO" /LENGTH=105 /DNA_ID=CAMNT_0019246551 /DNA_START=212 /DNA_END=529 /DNA_ORIENTATION=-